LHTGDTIEVTALEAAQGGWCVARPEGAPVVFVRHALPGERVRARVTEVTSKLARADAVEVLDASPDRVAPPCPSARPGGCGGCDWQHATLPAQRALKASVVAQQLRRLAGIDRDVTVEPLPGDEPDGQSSGESADGDENRPGLGWRTRVQFAVREDGVAGLRAHRSHEVIDVGDCLIAHPAIRDLGIPRLSWPGATGVEAVTGEAADGGDQRAVIVSSGRKPERGRYPARGSRKERGEQSRTEGARAGATSQPESRQPESRGAHGGPDGVTAVTAETVLRRAGRKRTPVRGGEFLNEHAAGRDWRVSAGGFWQVHPAAAGTLTEAVLDALEPRPGDTALDLYCGAGLFAGALARVVGPDGTVIGIESDEAAVRDARHNLRATPWARTHRGDVAQVLGRGGLPLARLAVADPPRAGLDRVVVDYLTNSGTERFAYVSCDSATFARDIGLLVKGGWRLDALRAFDAFPMTHHVECVATLTR
jgi:tRNA/tmRNA/rRNA uracil-C5-methylase (TrmA/RlmC/RlmD family)